MALTDHNSLHIYLGGKGNWSDSQMTAAINAATSIADYVTNRELVATTHRFWQPPGGISRRSDVLLLQYPLIALRRAYSDSAEGGRITDAMGDLVTLSIVDGTLHVGSESFDLDSYATLALLKAAVDAGDYSMTVTSEGDPLDMAVDSLGVLMLPDNYTQVDIISANQGRVRGNFTFIEYYAGYEKIPEGLKQAVNRLAVVFLESGAPAGAGLGQQLDKASAAIDLDTMFNPWKRVEFHTWHEDGQVTSHSRAGWIGIN